MSAMIFMKLSSILNYQKGYAHAVIYKLIAGVLRQAQSLLFDVCLPPEPKTGRS